jgi:predicted TIM-barrel fold metal-dependent hydrolase
MKIDLHCHAFPGGFFRAAKAFYPDAIELGQDEQRRLLATWAGTTLPAWDHAGRLADIDRAGIDIGILSCPPVYSRVDEHAPELCRLVNDAIAAACRRDPQRFRGFAHLPFNDMKLALEEMRRALGELGFVGVLVTSNIGGAISTPPNSIHSGKRPIGGGCRYSCILPARPAIATINRGRCSHFPSTPRSPYTG